MRSSYGVSVPLFSPEQVPCLSAALRISDQASLNTPINDVPVSGYAYDTEAGGEFRLALIEDAPERGGQE